MPRPAAGLFLWRRSLAKRRRRLDLRLLFLLAASALLVLALARPWVAAPSREVALVLDASASMAAGDRWARARKIAAARLRGARRAVLVRAGLRPAVYGPARGRDLLKTLASLRPGDAGADLEAAVAAAHARLPGAPVVVVSDDAPPPGVGYRNVAAMEPNLGIVALGPGFLAVGNAGPGPRTATVRVNGRRYRVRVPERGFAGVAFPLAEAVGARLPGGDALPLDDRDDLVLHRVRVGLERKDPALLRALALLSAVPVPPGQGEVEARTGTPAGVPYKPTLFFAERAVGEAIVADRDPADPLLMGTGILGERLPVPPPPGAGFRPVALGPGGEGIVWRAGASLYLPPLSALAERPYFPLLVARFLAPFRHPKKPLGAGGVWVPGVRDGVAYALEAPFETLLPRPRPDRPSPARGRLPLFPGLVLLALFLLVLEGRLGGRLGP